VRIAPSPTGYFHVGTARTAIYNYLFARHHGGQFLVRIEDTDLDRSEAQYVDVILDGLRWLGMEWDEKPLYQSERTHLYSPEVQRLLDTGRAYRCYCTPEELEAERKRAQEAKSDWKYSRRCRYLSDKQRAAFEAEGRESAVRLAVPEEGATTFHDLVGGELTRQNADIEDFVIARSDGRALYNFVVVVDDHLMQISHVIRGNDHITNTFKQVLLYDALEWEAPQFAHLPMILRPDKSKVSKRKGDPSVTDYRDWGYLPQAMFNYLCLLGWSAGDDREIYTLPELIEAFDISRVNASNPIFDPTKLEWMNGEYIRASSPHDLGELLKPYLFNAHLITPLAIESRWAWFLKVIAALQERCKVLTDFVEQGAYFFRPPNDYDSKGVQKHFGVDGAADRLRRLADAWESSADFEPETLDSVTKRVAESDGVKVAAYIHPTRLALSGTTKGPGLYVLAALVGRRECLERLRRAAEAIDHDRVAVRQPIAEGEGK